MRNLKSSNQARSPPLLWKSPKLDLVFNLQQLHRSRTQRISARNFCLHCRECKHAFFFRCVYKEAERFYAVSRIRNVLNGESWNFGDKRELHSTGFRAKRNILTHISFLCLQQSVVPKGIGRWLWLLFFQYFLWVEEREELTVKQKVMLCIKLIALIGRTYLSR